MRGWLSGHFAVADTLPALPKTVPAGIPSALIERRPDLSAAFERLCAVDKRLERARKALLPRFALTASGGAALSELVDPCAAAWHLALGLVQPLFTGGRLHGEIHLQRARVEEALNGYRSTLSAQSAHLTARQQLLNNRIDLHLALGGGF